MKKERKRQIRDFDKYLSDCKEYYGILKVNHKIAIDPKRLFKLELINKEELSYINSIPRNTHYFYPTKNRNDLLINDIKRDFRFMRFFWTNEVLPFIKNVKTPSQVADEERANSIAHLSDMDDIDIVNERVTIARIKREAIYPTIIHLFYIQHFLGIVAILEQMKISTLVRKGYSKKDFGETSEQDFFNENGFNKSEIMFQEEYRAITLIANFLKHSSKKSYDRIISHSIARTFLNQKKFSIGEFAHTYIRDAMKLIRYALEYGEKYELSYCSVVTGENSNSYLETKDYYLDLVRSVE